MGKLRTVVLMAGLALCSTSSVHAAPGMALPRSGSIELVSGGCGPGGHRDPYGYCRPNGPYGYGYGRPVYRGCPPGMHPTPYGCRPNF